MGAVVIGMDPHKRSAAIEVTTGDETVLDGGRFVTSATDSSPDIGSSARA